MKTKFLIVLCSALSFCVEVYADGEQEVRRGLYPYMAFIYYPDESVVDGTGSRFLRGAILIRPDWLVTSAVGPSIVTDGPNGFPRKTLLARLGAVTIDTNFTLNEDEEEQEREVIQIVRPYNHSATQWWRTDISLMKVLLPFNITSAVANTNLNLKQDLGEKMCFILVFTKRDSNDTDDKSLMQISVEMLPPSLKNCGSHFIGDTMTCAADSDENKNAVYDNNFCQGNSGGPLICENEVVGLQTYIDNDCKQPHLYQLLYAWENFITCGTEDKCQEEKCAHICDVVNKDVPVIHTTASSETTDASTETTKASTETTKASSEQAKEILVQNVTSPMPQVTSAITETTINDIEIVTPTATTNVVSQEITPTDIPPSVNDPTSTQAVSEVETTETKSWSNENFTDERRKLDKEDILIEKPKRKPRVQAQKHSPTAVTSVPNTGPSNASNTLSFLWFLHFGMFDLMLIFFYV